MFQKIKQNPAFPFVAPFVLFMLFLVSEGIHPSAVYIIYPIKTVVVGFFIISLFDRLPSIDFHQPVLGLIAGVLVFVLWVFVGPHITMGKLEGGFNPFLFETSEIAWGLVVIRILGAALVVPMMEELFWRGFLQRYLIDESFEKISLGRFTHFSFWATTVLFASVHGALAPIAFISGLIYGLLFIKTKCLGTVILAHGLTNLLLGIYVVYTKQWFFW